jgi:hypothetical protein
VVVRIGRRTSNRPNQQPESSVVTKPRFAALGLLVVNAGAVAYLVLTALSARDDLETARRDLQLVRTELLAGNQQQADRDLIVADSAAAAAQRRTSGPLWAFAAAVPWLGSPVDTVRTLASSAHELTKSVLPQVASTVDAIAPSRLRIGPGAVDLAPLTAAAPTLAAADAHAVQIQHRVAGEGTWLGVADRARRQMLTLLTQLRTQLDDGTAAATVLPPMLGADGPRTYLLVFENDAEARGLGGLPGGYALLHADAGKLTFTRFGSDADIPINKGADIGPNFGGPYEQYGAAQDFRNSDFSPHFPYVAQIWMAHVRKLIGKSFDGAITADPTALSYLLKVTGPAKASDGTPVSADNVVTLTESAAYARFRDGKARKAFFVDVAKAAADRIVHTPGRQTRALVTALGRSVGERRLLVWSAHSDEEARLAALPIGGLLPKTTGPFTALAVDNAAGGKLDFYLGRALSYVPTGCDRKSRHVTVTVTLHNGAPPRGLPPYVLIRSDHPKVPGSDHVFAFVYASQGARVTGATVDGHPADAATAHELGYLVASFDVDLRPGQTTTAVLHLDEPRNPGPVATFVQPLVLPLQQAITQPTC